MTTKKEQQTEVVEYAPGGSSALEVIRENVGGHGLNSFDLPRVKIPAGGSTTWEIPTLEGPSAARAVDGVIIHWNTRRAYWQDKNVTGAPPDCSSNDGLIGFGWNSQEPDAESKDLQYDPDGRAIFSHVCSACPLGGDNAWGSAVDAKGEPSRGKACKEIRQLFVLMPGELLPIIVSLSPTSISESHKFFMRMASGGVPFYGAEVSLGLKAASNNGQSYAVLSPSVTRRLDEEESDRIKSYRAGILPMLETVGGEAVAD